MISTFTDFNMPIAERRVKRQKSEPGKHLQYEVPPVEKKAKPKPKKSQDSGWFKVDGIVGHRIVKEKNRDQIELRVKWQGYSEPTWESFTNFAKDTTPLVERYLLRQSLMRPLDFYMEFKRLRSLEVKPSELTQSQIKELKASFTGFHNILFAQEKAAASMAPSTHSTKSMT